MRDIFSEFDTVRFILEKILIAFDERSGLDVSKLDASRFHLSQARFENYLIMLQEGGYIKGLDYSYVEEEGEKKCILKGNLKLTMVGFRYITEKIEFLAP